MTPNRRLARALRLEVAERRIGAGDSVWETPRVLTLGAWLRRVWSEPTAEPRPALLSPTQARAIWEQVVDSDAAGLLLPAGAASTAAEAWALLHGWQLDLGHPAFGDAADSRAFRDWARGFAGACDAGDWLDDARLPDAVATRIADGRLPAPERLVLYAFDELSPQLQALRDALAGAGCEIVRLAPARIAGHVRRTDLPTFDDELHAAAHWARAALEADPGVRVGLVVPDLAAARDRVARVLDAVLAPERLRLGGLDHARPYGLSLGGALAERPPVHAALELLGLLRPGPQPFATVSALLRSPHLGHAATEAIARARAELALRDVARADWHLDAALRLVARHAPAFAERVAAARERLNPGRDEHAPPRRPGDWATRIGAALEAAGWPGDAPLDSAAFQAVGAFHELLADLARLDAVTGPLTFSGLLARLARLARERVFQPAGGDARVEALGLLEASGRRFDRLWICGLDDVAWPPPARPNPFLPKSLRREHALPRSTPEREAEVAARLTAAFAAAADEVVFSHARRDGDAELAPSPLLLGWPWVAVDTFVDTNSPGPVVRIAATVTEPFVDERAPPIPGGLLRGGTQRVGLQSACPFRAFAHHRLGAEALGPPPRGLDAMTRGNLVHKVLQALWEAHGAAIATAERRRDHVTLACARAIDGEEALLGDRPKLRAIEQARLVKLVEMWLDVDRDLPRERTFEVEKTLVHRIGDHAVRLRIDRIDTLADGRVAVVDYKTGARQKFSDWGEVRPREPQLPLYAAALGADRVAALAFGRVHVEGCGYSGTAVEAGLLPGLRMREGAAETIVAAAEAAEALLSDHAAGNAAVDPAGGACDYCGLEALCRVHERGVVVAGEDDD